MLTKTAHFIGIFSVFTFILIIAVSQLNKHVLKIDPLDIQDHSRRSNLNPKRFEERKNNLREFCKDRLTPTMPIKEGFQNGFRSPWEAEVLAVLLLVSSCEDLICNSVKFPVLL